MRRQVRWSKSSEVQGETLEIGERAVVGGAYVRSPQDHAGRATRLQRLLPARRTQAPAVAGPQAGKAELRHRCRKIIAPGLGKLEKLGSHDGADRVAADVFSSVLQQPSRKNPVWGSMLDAFGERSPLAQFDVETPQEHDRRREFNGRYQDQK